MTSPLSPSSLTRPSDAADLASCHVTSPSNTSTSSVSWVDSERRRYLRKAGGSVLMDTALYFSSLPSKISSHSEAFSRVTLVAADSQRDSTSGSDMFLHQKHRTRI